MAETAIEWAERVWNPVTGCDRVSPGCANCYAMTLAKRLKAMGNPRYQNDGDRTSGPGFGVTLHPDKLDEPLRRRTPSVYFVNSMSDLFHEEVPFEFIDEVFHVMAKAERHTFQVLTKRPERMRDYFEYSADRMGGLVLADPNVWLGVSIENRRFVHRADLLRQTSAAVRFISAEPLLGPLVWDAGDGLGHQTDTGYVWNDYTGPQLDLTGIDWLIAGGESGKGHRRLDLQWVRDLRDACAASGTAYFVKQLGGHRPGNALEDLPPDLRIREMPQQQSVNREESSLGRA